MSGHARLTRARVHGARVVLERRAERVMALATAAQAEGRVPFAASLRGKARAYMEAVRLLDALENDRALPPYGPKTADDNHLGT